MDKYLERAGELSEDEIIGASASHHRQRNPGAVRLGVQNKGVQRCSTPSSLLPSPVDIRPFRHADDETEARATAMTTDRSPRWRSRSTDRSSVT